MQTLSLFGATGTIGGNVLDIISQHREKYSIKILTAKDNVDQLAALAHHWHPQCLVVNDAAGRDKLAAALPDFAPDFAGEILCGADGLAQAAQQPTDLAVMAITGFAALAPTLALAQQGVRIVLANKESLVAGGALLMAVAAKTGAQILPADSEHNGIFQLLQGQKKCDVEKIVLTASGGPFRTTPQEALAHVTPEAAIAHPNWTMGAKISVDSATMMNKGLELIEAQHLFALKPAQCEVLVHPQSIVHGLVYFCDGTVLAHKSLPDMRTPLAHCMGYPERLSINVPRLDLAAVGRLDFAQADREKFPCLALAEAAMRAGGFAPVILNAANEVAVQAFLARHLAFTDIAKLVAEIIDAKSGESGDAHNLENLVSCDLETRKMAQNVINTWQ